MSDLLAERIAEAKNGKQRAFSWLLDEFWIDVYNFQLKRVGSEAEAEDITVQTFARAFDKISSFDEQYSFRTWLITISKNIHIDLLRRQSEPILHLDTEEKESKRIADESPTIEDSLIMEQQFDYLLKCIKQLKDPYRTAIQLRYLQEKSYKEIAEEMSSTMSNVKITLLRAKKILAEILKRKTPKRGNASTSFFFFLFFFFFFCLKSLFILRLHFCGECLLLQ
jgi:RNA polymerase sigma factor, sigma-70 family